MNSLTNYYVNSLLTNLRIKFNLSLLIFISIPKIIYAPIETNPIHYWKEYTDMFICKFEDNYVPSYPKTIFDNWRWHMKKGWD